MASTLQIGATASTMADVPIEPDDIAWGLQDISASDSGRTQDANCTMNKNRIAQKRKLSLSWINPSMADTSTILKMVNPEYIYVRFLDPMEGALITKRCYVGDRSSPFRQITLHNPDGTKTTMKTLSFDIIER